MTTRISPALILILFLGATSCTPILEIDSAPTPETVKISISSAVASNSREKIATCAAKDPSLALQFDSDPKSAAIYISWGEPVDGFSGFATILGWDTLQIITHPESNFKNPNEDEIMALFTESPPDFEIWTYPKGDQIRATFDQIILQENPISPYAMIAPNPDSMLAEIRQDRNAVGYLPGSWVTADVKTIELPAQLVSNLHIPILGITESEPEGPVREFLICLQAEP